MIKAWKPVGGYAFFTQAPDKSYYRVGEGLGNSISFMMQKGITKSKFDLYDSKLKKKYQSMTGREVNNFLTLGSFEEFDSIFGTNLRQEWDGYNEKRWEKQRDEKRRTEMSEVVKVSERKVEAVLVSNEVNDQLWEQYGQFEKVLLGSVTRAQRMGRIAKENNLVELETAVKNIASSLFEIYQKGTAQMRNALRTEMGVKGIDDDWQAEKEQEEVKV